MKKNRTQKLSTLNRVILTTLIAVFIVFCLLIILVTNVLLTNSININKSICESQADYIIQAIKDNLNYFSLMLNFSQRSLGLLNFNSNGNATSCDFFMAAILDLNPNIYCAWFGFGQNTNNQNGHFIKRYIRHNDEIIQKIIYDDNRAGHRPRDRGSLVRTNARPLSGVCEQFDAGHVLRRE